MKTVLKFYSPTCGPCKVLSKNLEGFTDIDLKEIDITDDENQELVMKYGVRAVPTTVIISEDKEEKFTGVLTIDRLKEILC